MIRNNQVSSYHNVENIKNKTYKLKNKLKDDYENNKENFKVYK